MMPMELVHRPITGTNSMKKCSQRLLEKAIEDHATAVGSDRGVGLFFLGGLERLEGVGLLAVLKQGVFHGGAVNGAEQCTAEDAGDAHHSKGFGVQLWKPWRKRRKRGNHTEGGREEPTALAEGVHQEDADEHRDRTEGDGVVRADADETGDLELTQHEADQAKAPCRATKAQGRRADTSNEVALGFRAPEQQQAVTHRISGGGHSSGEEVATFQVRGGNAVGVPGGDKGGAGQPIRWPGRPWAAEGGQTSQ